MVRKIKCVIIERETVLNSSVVSLLKCAWTHVFVLGKSTQHSQIRSSPLQTFKIRGGNNSRSRLSKVLNLR